MTVFDFVGLVYIILYIIFYYDYSYQKIFGNLTNYMRFVFSTCILIFFICMLGDKMIEYIDKHFWIVYNLYSGYVIQFMNTPIL